MGWLSTLGKIAGVAAAPFTGGTSLALTLGGIGADVAGSILGNKESARTSTSTPTLNPAYQGLSDLLRQRAMERLNMSGDTAGLAANGISNINDAYKGINQSTANSLTNRGLANSPVAGTSIANTNIARGGDISQFLNNLPLLQQQLQTTDFNNAGNILARNTGVTGVGAGSAVGAGLNDLSGYLGYLNQLKRLGNTPGGGIPTSTDTTSGQQYPY